MTAPLTELRTDADGIAVLTMRDGPRRNALTLDMAAELEERFKAVHEDGAVKVLVLAGTDECFSTGADRAMLEQLVSHRVRPRDLLLPRWLLDVPVPTIAAMAGHAVGGGLALAICADITVAARESRYGATFMRYGFTPGLGMTALLEYVMGPPIAHELLLTGRTCRGARFEGSGAFTHVVARSDVQAKAIAIARELAEKPRLPLVLLKAALSRRKRELFEAARTVEGVMHEATFATPDVARLIEELD
jgi:polyketide biosynthesis enoyl-CoA hydratase PksI